jgi:hypothetical protein
MQGPTDDAFTPTQNVIGERNEGSTPFGKRRKKDPKTTAIISSPQDRKYAYAYVDKDVMKVRLADSLGNATTDAGDGDAVDAMSGGTKGDCHDADDNGGVASLILSGTSDFFVTARSGPFSFW